MNHARCTIKPAQNRIWPTRVCVGDPNLPRSGLCVWDEGGSRPTQRPATYEKHLPKASRLRCWNHILTTCYSSIHRWRNYICTPLRHNLPARRFLCLPTPVWPHTFHRVTSCSSSLSHTWAQVPNSPREALLPKTKCIRCWNHIFRSARYWCHSHNVKSAETFISDLRELFHKPTSKGYETELQLFSPSWSNPVFQYYIYMKNIHPEVYTSIGRWVLEKEGVYSPFSGVITNQSESFKHIK